jgi:hypothetical protein
MRPRRAIHYFRKKPIWSAPTKWAIQTDHVQRNGRNIQPKSQTATSVPNAGAALYSNPHGGASPHGSASAFFFRNTGCATERSPRCRRRRRRDAPQAGPAREPQPRRRGRLPHGRGARRERRRRGGPRAAAAAGLLRRQGQVRHGPGGRRRAAARQGPRRGRLRLRPRAPGQELRAQPGTTTARFLPFPEGLRGAFASMRV